jgi:hypothetical protein
MSPIGQNEPQIQVVSVQDTPVMPSSEEAAQDGGTGSAAVEKKLDNPANPVVPS